MNKEPLFHEDNYTPCSHDISDEFYQAILPIFEKYKNHYSIRELLYLAFTAAHDVELQILLEPGIRGK